MVVARYELKFLIDAGTKQALVESARSGLCPDSHGPTYRVTSLYFDTADLRWFWEKMDGVPLRRKLRLRYYGEAPESCFLELKRRHYNHVVKERQDVTTAYGLQLLEDERRPLDTSGAQLMGTAVVTYVREAWMGVVDPRLRVTFDHLCQALVPGDHHSAPANVGIPLLPEPRIILEVKFDQRLPVWLRNQLNYLRVRPVRFSKYAEAVMGLRRPAVRQLSQAGRPWPA